MEALQSEVMASQVMERGLREGNAKAQSDANSSRAEVDQAHVMTGVLQKRLLAATDRLRKQELVIKVGGRVCCCRCTQLAGRQHCSRVGPPSRGWVWWLQNLQLSVQEQRANMDADVGVLRAQLHKERHLRVR